MADLEDVTLDGRPLQSLRVADLKAALEERGLSKSGQKNALVKRLKGALMLENLQRTSTAHIGLQPNSHIGEEMSQNSFIKQYLAKQQELLRQRLEREAREAFETNDQEGHAEVNNSTSCPPQAQDVTPALAEQHKPPGPSGEEGLFGSGNKVEGNRSEEADISGPPASGSVPMRVSGGDHRPERGSTSSEVAADSDDEDSEDGEEDADDDDWDSSARRRSLREPARVPTTRERSGASCQPQQQHIPSLLSPQLRQPTPPPSPPPELSFPLPDTPKQSPPSPDVDPGRRSPSTSSSGSSSSGSRSSSPEPQRSGQTERRPGPLTLLARKMESEGAFSGAGWHGGDGEGDRQDGSSLSGASFPARGPLEGLVSAISHTTNTAGNVPGPMNPGRCKGIIGQPTHSQVPLSILKSTETEERESEVVKEAAFELERQEKQRKLDQERAMELERERALALECEEKQRALEKEMLEHHQALVREEQEKALQREQERQERELALEQEKKLALERERQERELALERERQERELALVKEREEREQALAQERALELERRKELERQRALEQERLQREREEREKQEREEKEKAMELERAKALEREREERERALEQERLDRERALEAERKEKERIERELALEKERLEREKALEEERIKRERALEQERLERERALEQERLERALEQERLERERALEQERLERERALEQERIEREEALERERVEKERLEREKALEQERLEKERVLEQERLERERALEQERLERERKEKERVEKERLEQERIEREKALELEREEKERSEREAALEKKRIERERVEKEEIERLKREKALEQERLEMVRAIEKEKERALEEEREKALEQERLDKEKAMQKEEQETALLLEQGPVMMAEKEKESCLPPANRGCEIDPAPLPTTSLLSTGPATKSSVEAGEQEHVHSPMSQSETQAAETPLSPQSSFKKFRFLRDSPIKPQSSSTSVVIKQPRSFSDTPQPQALPVVSPIIVGEQQQEGHQPAAKLEDPQMLTNLEAVGLPGSFAIQSEKEMTSSKEQADSVKTEHSDKDSTKKIKEVDESKSLSTPVDLTQREGRDTKKEEKTRKRSSSSDSSSSDSDSGSSSSRYSRSSATSQEETSSISRVSRVEKSARDSSPQYRITDEAGGEGSSEIPKASPHKRQRFEVDVNTTADGHSHVKKPFTESSTQEETVRKRKDSEREEEEDKQSQVTETVMAESEKLPENCEETPKVFSARKISLSSNKLSPGTSSAEGDQESGAAAGRKRRWGSSTAVTAKKPSISITTDSLKSLIPDIRPCLGQEAVVDLHPEEAALSGIEEEEREHSDQDLQIRRTVTQVVHSESQENGQKEAKRSRLEEQEEEDLQEEGETTRIEEKMDTSFPGAVETQSPSQTSHDVEINTVTPSDTFVRRSISQQKTGVSITIDDPVRTSRQPSPPRGKVSNIVHVCNLVRPFTLGQLKELLRRTGTLVEEGFWIDKIKSHCYVTYSSSEEAVATRAALHGVKWPQSNPKVLSVDFCLQDELDFHKGLGAADRSGAEDQGAGPVRGRTSGLPSLLPERDQWADREREMERREKTRAEREWDRDKVKEFGKLGGEKEGGPRRSCSRERRRKERGKSKEKKTEKKEKTAEDPPAKLLDDLFCKTKAAPCIYWLPLTEEQFVQRETARAERIKEREKRRKEQEAEEEKKREEERKERMKTGGGTTGDRSEGDKDKDRERDRERERGRDRERERENDKRRDGYRRPGGSGAGSSRRSRSRSDPRERRR